MVAIELRFPAGRFHATPWDKQVNEGITEWPPSPWRILRALISTRFHKARDEVGEDTLKTLVQRLSTPPIFSLPPATSGHTRHYMPLYKSTIDGKTTKVFDAFIRIPHDGRLQILWPGLELDEGERAALDLLVSRLGYLGRAEAWVEARLVDDKVVRPNSEPIDEGEGPPQGCEAVRVLTCMAPDRYLVWRQDILVRRRDRRLAELRSRALAKGKPSDDIQLTERDEERLKRGLPLDLYNALLVDTGQLKSDGWSDPPGCLWLEYSRPEDALTVRPDIGKDARRIAGMDLPTVARFAVASQVTPRLTDSVSLAERVHVSLVSLSDGASVFTGCDEGGEPLEGHRHAHILCESNPGIGRGSRGEITHVTVYAPMGFGPVERGALDRLTRVWGHGGHDVQLVLLGIGDPEDFSGTDIHGGGDPILSESRGWVSRTPFVPTRHPKSTSEGPKLDDDGVQIGSPEHDLRRLISLAGLPRPVFVEAIHSTDLGGHETRWLHFRRERRSGEGRRAGSLAYGFRIEFPEPVRGPIALGYGSHYGLGLFMPFEP